MIIMVNFDADVNTKNQQQLKLNTMLTSQIMKKKFILEEKDDCHHHINLMSKMISNIINEMLKRGLDEDDFHDYGQFDAEVKSKKHIM